MTDTTLTPEAAADTAKAAAKSRSLYHIDDLTRKRNAAEKRFKAYGITAIAIGLFFLVVLATSIVSHSIFGNE